MKNEKNYISFVFQKWGKFLKALDWVILLSMNLFFLKSDLIYY